MCARKKKKAGRGARRQARPNACHYELQRQQVRCAAGWPGQEQRAGRMHHQGHDRKQGEEGGSAGCRLRELARASTAMRLCVWGRGHLPCLGGRGPQMALAQYAPSLPVHQTGSLGCARMPQLEGAHGKGSCNVPAPMGWNCTRSGRCIWRDPTAQARIAPALVTRSSGNSVKLDHVHFHHFDF